MPVLPTKKPTVTEFRVTYGGETTLEKGEVFEKWGKRIFGLYESEEGIWTLIHIPSEHPVCNFTIQQHAVNMALLLLKEMSDQLEYEDRAKIKEELSGGWIERWVIECHKARLWIDPEQIKKTLEKERQPIRMQPKALSLGESL